MSTESKVGKKPQLLRKETPAVMNFPVKLGDVVEFKVGLLGFENIHSYRFRVEENYMPFVFLDGQEDESVSFICVDTFYAYADYEINISPQLMRNLEISSLTDVAVFSIVTVGESLESTTANLLSPIIVNLKTLKGEQVILENSDYPVRYQLGSALAGKNETSEQAG